MNIGNLDSVEAPEHPGPGQPRSRACKDRSLRDPGPSHWACGYDGPGELWGRRLLCWGCRWVGSGVRTAGAGSQGGSPWLGPGWGAGVKSCPHASPLQVSLCDFLQDKPSGPGAAATSVGVAGSKVQPPARGCLRGLRAQRQMLEAGPQAGTLVSPEGRRGVSPGEVKRSSRTPPPSWPPRGWGWVG